MNSPLRLGVSPTARTPTGFPTRDSEALFPHTGEHLRLHPLLLNRCIKTKNMAKCKNRSMFQKKIQLRDEEVDNLSDADFKTLVIRMLTEMVEYG